MNLKDRWANETPEKKKKSRNMRKGQSEKSTTIEKSLCPFKHMSTLLMNKYLQSQERK